MKRLAVSALLLALLVGCGAPREQSSSRTVFAMDTVMTLTAYGQPEVAEAALRSAEEEIRRLDHLLSVTDPGSEIAMLNQAKTATVSKETASLLESALEVSRTTEGAYDMTLGRITEAWGFRSGELHVPDASEISRLLSGCGYEHVQVKGTQVELGANMAVDLGGIAKGYTAERVMAVLQESGIKNAVVSLGGNVGTMGQKPEGGPWRVAVENPDHSGEYSAVLLLSGGLYAVTSGAYERYFEEDGVVYHHILDPKTGYPAESDLKSVTVVSPDGTMADGLSTALFVMGFDRASAFWRRHSDEFQMVLITEDGVFATPDLTMDSGRDVTILEEAP